MTPARPADNSDDQDVPDEERLWRRVLFKPDRVQWADPETKTRVRPSSANFKDGNGEVSVTLGSMANLEAYLKCHPHVGVAAVTAGSVRRLGYRVVLDPADDDPHHHVIYNPRSPAKGISDGDARKLAKEADWVHCPPELVELKRRSEGGG